MLQTGLKVIIAAVLLVAASEVGKRSALLGAILISIPLSSVLAISFLYFDTGDAVKVIALCKGIVLMLIPSFAFFALMILLLKLRQPFWLSLGASCLGMALVFAGYSALLQRWGLMTE